MQVVLVLLTLAGCGYTSANTQEEVAIPPAPSGLTTDLGLGPGVRLLSFGPGDKSSPRVSPSGERVAFVLDGYLAEKPLYTMDFRRVTAKNFDAKHTEWLPDGSLAILGPEDETEVPAPGTPRTPSPLFGIQPDDGSSDPRKLAERVEAASAAPGGGAVVVAVASSTGSPRSRLMLLRGSEKPVKVYLRSIEGYVTGLSVSPDGSQAILAVRRDAGGSGEGQESGRYEIQAYQFSEDQVRRVARVPAGMEVLGAPQWTSKGVHFLAGKAGETGESEAVRSGEAAPYTLYRAPSSSVIPEPVRGIGEDFVAASIGVSPDGDQLAVLGRRNPGAPTNLYVLDLDSNTLRSATANENMEIKTNPRDLSWSPDGSSVILVARGALSGPEVYDAPARGLSSAFYNLYEVPVDNNGESEQ